MTGSSEKPSSVSDLELTPGEIHLWLCPAPAAAALDASVLSADEAERHARRGGQGLLGRVLARHILSRYAGESPQDWEFLTGRHGKPELVAPSRPLHHNLSHSGDWLALAICESAAVGVDVQVMDAGRSLRRLSRRYYSAAEQEDLGRLEGEAFTRYFYHLWSLKEAWTKVLGDALPGALGNTGFRIDGDQLLCLDPDKTAGSSFWLLDLAGFSLAVCGLAGGLSLRCFEWNGKGAATPREVPVLASSGVP